jgi:hypothetical protein
MQRHAVDDAAGSLLWRRELGNGSELFSDLAVDPLDCRRLCLCGSQGALAVVQLGAPLPDRAEVQQYRVNIQSSGRSVRYCKDSAGGGAQIYLWLCQLSQQSCGPARDGTATDQHLKAVRVMTDGSWLLLVLLGK